MQLFDLNEKFGQNLIEYLVIQEKQIIWLKYSFLFVLKGIPL